MGHLKFLIFALLLNDGWSASIFRSPALQINSRSPNTWARAVLDGKGEFETTGDQMEIGAPGRFTGRKIFDNKYERMKPSFYGRKVEDSYMRQGRSELDNSGQSSLVESSHSSHSSFSSSSSQESHSEVVQKSATTGQLGIAPAPPVILEHPAEASPDNGAQVTNPATGVLPPPEVLSGNGGVPVPVPNSIGEPVPQASWLTHSDSAGNIAQPGLEPQTLTAGQSGTAGNGNPAGNAGEITNSVGQASGSAGVTHLDSVQNPPLNGPQPQPQVLNSDQSGAVVSGQNSGLSGDIAQNNEHPGIGLAVEPVVSGQVNAPESVDPSGPNVLIGEHGNVGQQGTLYTIGDEHQNLENSGVAGPQINVEQGQGQVGTGVQTGSADNTVLSGQLQSGTEQGGSGVQVQSADVPVMEDQSGILIPVESHPQTQPEPQSQAVVLDQSGILVPVGEENVDIHTLTSEGQGTAQVGAVDSTGQVQSGIDHGVSDSQTLSGEQTPVVALQQPIEPQVPSGHPQVVPVDNSGMSSQIQSGSSSSSMEHSESSNTHHSESSSQTLTNEQGSVVGQPQPYAGPLENSGVSGQVQSGSSSSNVEHSESSNMQHSESGSQTLTNNGVIIPEPQVPLDNSGTASQIQSGSSTSNMEDSESSNMQHSESGSQTLANNGVVVQPEVQVPLENSGMSSQIQSGSSTSNIEHSESSNVQHSESGSQTLANNGVIAQPEVQVPIDNSGTSSQIQSGSSTSNIEHSESSNMQHSESSSQTLGNNGVVVQPEVQVPLPVDNSGMSGQIQSGSSSSNMEHSESSNTQHTESSSQTLANNGVAVQPEVQVPIDNSGISSQIQSGSSSSNMEHSESSNIQHSESGSQTLTNEQNNVVSPSGPVVPVDNSGLSGQIQSGSSSSNIEHSESSNSQHSESGSQTLTNNGVMTPPEPQVPIGNSGMSSQIQSGSSTSNMEHSESSNMQHAESGSQTLTNEQSNVVRPPGPVVPVDNSGLSGQIQSGSSSSNVEHSESSNMQHSESGTQTLVNNGVVAPLEPQPPLDNSGLSSQIQSGSSISNVEHSESSNMQHSESSSHTLTSEQNNVGGQGLATPVDNSAVSGQVQPGVIGSNVDQSGSTQGLINQPNGVVSQGQPEPQVPVDNSGISAQGQPQGEPLPNPGQPELPNPGQPVPQVIPGDNSGISAQGQPQGEPLPNPGQPELPNPGQPVPQVVPGDNSGLPAQGQPQGEPLPNPGQPELTNPGQPGPQVVPGDNSGLPAQGQPQGEPLPNPGQPDLINPGQPGLQIVPGDNSGLPAQGQGLTNEQNNPEGTGNIASGAQAQEQPVVMDQSGSLVPVGNEEGSVLSGQDQFGQQPVVVDPSGALVPAESLDQNGLSGQVQSGTPNHNDQNPVQVPNTSGEQPSPPEQGQSEVQPGTSTNVQPLGPGQNGGQISTPENQGSINPPTGDSGALEVGNEGQNYAYIPVSEFIERPGNAALAENANQFRPQPPQFVAPYLSQVEDTEIGGGDNSNSDLIILPAGPAPAPIPHPVTNPKISLYLSQLSQEESL